MYRVIEHFILGEPVNNGNDIPLEMFVMEDKHHYKFIRVVIYCMDGEKRTYTHPVDEFWKKHPELEQRLMLFAKEQYLRNDLRES